MCSYSYSQTTGTGDMNENDENVIFRPRARLTSLCCARSRSFTKTYCKYIHTMFPTSHRSLPVLKCRGEEVSVKILRQRVFFEHAQGAGFDVRHCFTPQCLGPQSGPLQCLTHCKHVRSAFPRTRAFERPTRYVHLLLRLIFMLLIA